MIIEIRENAHIFTVLLEEDRWKTFFPRYWKVFFKRVFSTLQDTEFVKKTPRFACSIKLTNDACIQKLNHQFRGKNKATNVLAFPDHTRIESDMMYIGDLVLAYETCFKESQAMNIPFLNHFSHVLLHGILHLAGYDHIFPEDAALMEQEEIRLLQKIGIPDPYGNN